MQCVDKLRYARSHFEADNKSFSVMAYINARDWLGKVSHACNSSTLRGWGGWITWGQEFEISLANIMKLRLYWKYKKLARHSGAPVIPATQEAEAGESLELGRQRLQWAEITPLHSSLDDESETPCQKKKKAIDYSILTMLLKMMSQGLQYQSLGAC